MLLYIILIWLVIGLLIVSYQCGFENGIKKRISVEHDPKTIVVCKKCGLSSIYWYRWDCDKIQSKEK